MDRARPPILQSSQACARCPVEWWAHLVGARRVHAHNIVNDPPQEEDRGSAGLLDADHDDREGTWNRGTAAAATAAGGWRRPRRWRRRWRPGLRCHYQQTARLAVKRDGARAVRWPGLQVLLDLETCR